VLEPLDADLSDRTVIVTGATAGIGKAAAHALARLRARVVLACRNREKGEAARREIAAAAGNPEVEVLLVDLSSQGSIRQAAAEFARAHSALHVLVNNAGVWLDQRSVTADDIETTWATNVLGYHLLTLCLLPLLEASAPARIVNVASEFASDLDLEDVELERRPYRGRLAYAQSKQADRMWTWALARRLEGKRVTANALHPGFVSSELFAKTGGVKGVAASLLAKLQGLPPREGADTAVWLAASRDLEGTNGRFWVKRRERPCRFRDPAKEDALFDLCASMTRLRPRPDAAVQC
jgi:NAD(P)-dependent dehydrogenase (short-subunit alcohol dehydrogenase family)